MKEILMPDCAIDVWIVVKLGILLYAAIRCKKNYCEQFCFVFSGYSIKESIDQVSREEIVKYEKPQERKLPSLVRNISLKMKRLPSFRRSFRELKHSWKGLNIPMNVLSETNGVHQDATWRGGLHSSI